MFRGTSLHTMDPKGRLIVPSRFRDGIKAGGGSGVMVTRLDGCLKAYPYDEWRNIEEQIRSISNRNERVRRFRRIFIGGAHDCVCDKQDRILIPPFLREYAGIQRDVALVGVLEHFEIWSKDRHEQETEAFQADLERGDVREDIAALRL